MISHSKAHKKLIFIVVVADFLGAKLRDKKTPNHAPLFYKKSRSKNWKIIFLASCVSRKFLAFSAKILAFCPKFSRGQKSLRFVRNSCAAEIFAFCSELLLPSKFLRFSGNSCVLLKILAPVKILAFCSKFLRPPNFLRFAQNYCSR